MNQRYIIDTTALISFFSPIFEVPSKITEDACNIISTAFETNENILMIPSIVFVEIFSKQFKSPEKAAAIRYEVFEKIRNCDNISIEPIDKELLSCFITITDIERNHNFDNHDKIIFATAMKYQAPLITSDQRLIRYNKRKKLIPEIIV